MKLKRPVSDWQSPHTACKAIKRWLCRCCCCCHFFFLPWFIELVCFGSFTPLTCGQSSTFDQKGSPLTLMASGWTSLAGASTLFTSLLFCAPGKWLPLCLETFLIYAHFVVHCSTASLLCGLRLVERREMSGSLWTRLQFFSFIHEIEITGHSETVPSSKH